jgi:dolichyl-phosphate mannosyltransferase polypeptide 3
MASKLVEWLYVAIPLGVVWLLLLNNFPVSLAEPVRFHVLIAPLYVLIAFGISCLLVLLYRVATFNECPEAHKQLREQIEQARSELKTKGFKFD